MIQMKAFWVPTYQRNDTQPWVDKNFLEEDHIDVIRMQREPETSEEKKKQQKLIEFETQRVVRRKEAVEKSKQPKKNQKKIPEWLKSSLSWM
jgi:hypothetical protein